MEIKPLVILFFYLLMIYTHATGCKEELGEGAGVILELTLQAEVNVKIMLIQYLNNA